MSGRPGSRADRPAASTGERATGGPPTGGAVTVGLLHPGEMGSAVGLSVRAGGARVVWASEGRGAATRERAEVIGLDDVETLDALVRASDLILAVAPPHAALDLARSVAARGFAGLYVDANAVSPGTAREIGRIVEKTGARFVDGGIIGPANRKPGAARIYLAGAAAAQVAPRFVAGPVAAVVLDGPPGAASALKMAFGGWNKGMSALLMSIRALALAEGVDQALLAEWGISMPDMPARSERAVQDNARKAWRFVGEMEEVARAFDQVGLPSGFHEAAGEVYRRLAGYKDTATPPGMDAVAGALRRLER